VNCSLVRSFAQSPGFNLTDLLFAGCAPRQLAWAHLWCRVSGGVRPQYRWRRLLVRSAHLSTRISIRAASVDSLAVSSFWSADAKSADVQNISPCFDVSLTIEQCPAVAFGSGDQQTVQHDCHECVLIACLLGPCLISRCANVYYDNPKPETRSGAAHCHPDRGREPQQQAGADDTIVSFEQLNM